MIINTPGVHTTPTAADIPVSAEVVSELGAHTVDEALKMMAYIAAGSYDGTNENTKTLDVGFVPKFILIMGSPESSGVSAPCLICVFPTILKAQVLEARSNTPHTTENGDLIVSVNGTEVSIEAKAGVNSSYAANSQYCHYTYIAIW